MNSLVSIIVPVYNELRYLKECVNSILNQTWTNIQVILVDDGSCNGAQRDCDLLGQTDKRITVVHKKNQGLSAARITGLHYAAGGWIMFVDDDDVISPWMVEELMDHAGNEELDIIAGRRMDSVTTEGMFAKQNKKAGFTILDGKTACNRIASDQQKNVITPLWGKIYRRQFLYGIELEKYRRICPVIFFEDVLMTPILYCRARKICLVKRAYYLHREVTDSISRSGKLTSFYYDQIESGNILLEFYKKNEMPEMYAYELQLYMKSILRIWCRMQEAEVGRIQMLGYQSRIKKYYNKYLYDFLKYGSCDFKTKGLSALFLVSKIMWRFAANRMYFNKR